MKLEIEDSAQHNEEIAERWKTVLELLVPQEVAKQMVEQKKVLHQLFYIDLQLIDDMLVWSPCIAKQC